MAIFSHRTHRFVAIAVAVAVLATLFGYLLGRDSGGGGGGSESQGITVPLVRGETLTDARETLAQLGLGVLVTYTVTDAAEPDVVISQSPGPDVRVDEGTVIHLTVSSQSASALSHTTENATNASSVALWNVDNPTETDARRNLSRITGTVAEVVHIPPAQYGAPAASPVVSPGGDSDLRRGKGND